MLDRVERLVKTDRNSVSVTIWSLANEAGYGTAFEAAAAHIRRYDPRPIQYADMNVVAEFDSQTYPTPHWLANIRRITRSASANTAKYRIRASTGRIRAQSRSS